MSKIENGFGADARVILRPVAQDIRKLRFTPAQNGFRLVVRAVDDFAGVASSKYVRSRFQRVYIDYREEWKCEVNDALLSAIYIQIGIPNDEYSTVDVAGIHFQPFVDYEVASDDETPLSPDQKRWVRGPHFHVNAGARIDSCHFFLGDDSRRRREVWGRASVAKQLRSHLIMTLDQIYSYVA